MRLVIFVALLTSPSLAWASRDAGPTLSASQVSATSGNAVLVQGSGFTAAEPVNIGLEGRTLAVVRTSGTGAFSVSVRIPAGIAPGAQQVVASDHSGTQAQLPFLVLGALRGRLVDVSIGSRALRGVVHARVYLPPGYAGSRLAYPALYFLHGLPGTSQTYTAHAAHVAQLAELLSARAIVVLPQGARDADSDAEYNDLGAGRNWERFVASELPAYVDAHFRTIRNRTARAILGISAGGYGAALAGLHHLATFSVVESWSGYFRPTDPSGDHVVDRGSPAANAEASAFSLVSWLAGALAREPSYLAFYVGDADRRFVSDNVSFDAQLTAANVTHEFRLYPGGHSWKLWDSHAEEWLGAALQHLAAPQPLHG
jgi:enterochelin esterase-like enzyme